MANKKTSVWETLSTINVSERVEKKYFKNKKTGREYGLSYLSWAWAWAEVKKRYPTASYEIHDDIFFPDNTVETRVSVTIEDQTHMMWLPVMDFKNDAKVNPTSREVSDTRMRCLTKAIAMHGMGHYIYAGEELPEGQLTEEEAKTNDPNLNMSHEEKAEAWLEFFHNDTVDATKFAENDRKFQRWFTRADELTQALRERINEAYLTKKTELML
ncbi:rad52-like recombinase [uncultured Mediterranean phage uvMED]|nr:rad52-like recombinase [uncultured Mediterranean phage uvMED]